MRILTLLFVLFLFYPVYGYSLPADSIAIKVAQADNCKKSMKYDQAFSLYQQLYQSNPDNIDFLVACAEMEVLMGKEKEALATYEKILKVDPDNLPANIYMGNYYYLTAELKRKKIDEEYNKSTASTRIKNQNYKKNLNLIYITDYSTSKKHFENVIRTFPSIEAKRTLEKIAQVEKFVAEK
ncbi:tetratricopeptide repeat protein [Bacteroides sp. 519]|uniref:tetratricopeptide repeat protein n=1 Tax=Bacteroides sp. 519 TaxID=2302937 RepID=UPI0013D78EB5|nr:tetratricopeptide repeat protein [Bacteroides sp. 519]NDV59245.1 tetratricopeptide repeat protein [Bacteroides sp. 519]